MCVGNLFKKPKTPELPAPPPTPSPPPTPTAVDSTQANPEDRKKRRDLLRGGLASTIKTSARGIFGTGPQLNNNLLGKNTLG